jgi:hypothetical protein
LLKSDLEHNGPFAYLLAKCASADDFNVMSTTIRLELPDEIAQQLESKWGDLPRAALESLVLEAYRCELVSAEQVRRLLAFATRFEVEEFLKQHGVDDYTIEDLERDRETLHDPQGRE